MSAAAPRGRLAPSPTGLLHVGHARSFLLAWLSVRSRGGSLVLRMEDLDTSRARPELEEACLRDLEWLGLDWDGPVVRQSERREELLEAALGLQDRGLAYPCTCTRREVEAVAAAPHAGEEGPRYPGTCRGRYGSLEEAEATSGRRAALRLAVPPGAVVEVEDLSLGTLRQDVGAAVGDFPLTSRDGQVAYQLAVVLDDARDGVDEVLRGEDLWSSTPRQALLQELLGLPRPTWIHVPLVVDDAGRRLAKRHDDLSLGHLREAGVPGGRLVAWLARSAGLSADGECSPAELLRGYALNLRPQGPIAFGDAARKALGIPD